MNEFTVQIVVNASAGVTPPRLLYNTNLNGRYKARFTGAVWVDDISNHAGDRLITITSSQFRNVYGTKTNSFVICNHNDHNLQIPQGHGFPFLWEANGPVDLEFIPTLAYDNTNNNTFKFAVLTFEVEKIEN